MEKNNKCGVSFPCNARHHALCTFGVQKIDSWDYTMCPACEHYTDGQCTNKEAIKDCLSKEGLSEV